MAAAGVAKQAAQLQAAIGLPAPETMAVDTTAGEAQAKTPRVSDSGVDIAAAAASNKAPAVA